MRILWCWRCRADMPMLDEPEWAEVMAANQAAAAALEAAAADRRVRRSAGTTFAQLTGGERQARFAPLLAAYERLTGFDETNPAAVWHHRAALYGPSCAACGRPLRTPRASFCAECGAPRAGGSAGAI